MNVGPTRSSVRDNASLTDRQLTQESFHAAVPDELSGNLFMFVGHLQRTTVYSQAHICQLSRGMTGYSSGKKAQLHRQLTTTQ